jgi:hypothetical protein
MVGEDGEYEMQSSYSLKKKIKIKICTKWLASKDNKKLIAESLVFVEWMDEWMILFWSYVHFAVQWK